ncbi:MAG: Glutamate--tRNA ligase 1 [Mycoplasmataceae bacterium]|nr:MAG: Glutamate--tRNA ligase 1 [Mycoplasmataceae bacterium]
MKNNQNFLRTRFAPSPTGSLHVGGVRTALFNYLLAKKSNGSFVLRIEDTDKKRSLEKYVKEQYKDLVWLGIIPDESVFKNGSFGPYQQTKRLEIYEKYLKMLLDKKRAYYCFCTKEELEKEREEYILRENKSNYKYSRKCLYLSEEEIFCNIKNNQNYLIRFFVEKGKVYKFKDIIRGEVSFSSDDIEDFVICRGSGIPLLNFAVVIDDYLMKITHVLRAEEHLPNTAKQLALYDFFEWKSPQFAHLSIILNSEKKKISKRDKEGKFQSVKSLKKLGYLPQSIINYLAFLGWNPKSTEEIFSLKELISVFDTNGLNPRSPIFSVDKLNWFNNHWIRKLSSRDFNELSWKFIKKQYSLSENKRIKSIKISKLFKDQLICFSELPILAKFFFKDLSKKITPISNDLKCSLEKLSNEILLLNKWGEQNIREIFKSNVQLISKENKKDFLLTFRKIITGNQKGPELPKIINLIGKRELKKRIRKTLKI